MKKNIILACLLLVASLLVGCGERVEYTRYYFSPSWTNAGKVIFVAGLQSVSKDILNSQLGSSYSQYVATIYPSGTGESSSLFNTTAATPYYMSCSPTRNYVAYMDELQSGLFGKVVIRNISIEAYTGMKDVEINFSSKIKSFDWSNDGNKIVYCTTTEVRIRDWNDFTESSDTLVTAESNLSFVSWKYGNKIAFVYTSGSDKLLSLISAEGSARVDLAAASSVDKPQISSSNTNEVYGVVGDTFVKVNVNTGTTTEVASSFTGETPYLSPSADKVVYSKSGESSGIYYMDVATGTETKIK